MAFVDETFESYTSGSQLNGQGGWACSTTATIDTLIHYSK